MMNEKRYLKNFIGFLKKNNAYKAFVKNLTYGNVYRMLYDEEYDEVKYIVNKIQTDPRNLLINAFNWGDLDDDVDWMTVSWEWDDYVSDLNRKLFKKN